MPKVSVIIPVYGVERYIERCARSLFNQTLDDIEYIFVNDCTLDNSINILKKVIAEFPNRKNQCIIVNMPMNTGQAGVRRQGIQLATGNYIIHCDSDDWVKEDMYKTMYDLAIKNDLDVVLCDYYKSDGKNIKLFHSFSGVEPINKDNALKYLLNVRISTSIWNKLVRRSVYLDNKIIYPTNNMWEDFVLSSQIFYYCKSVAYCPIPFYYYFTNMNSICHDNIDKIFIQLQNNAKLILNFLSEKSIDKKYDKEIVYFKWYSRSELVPYISQKKYYNLWLNTYPEINNLYKNNSCFTKMEKFKFWSMKLKVFPFLSIVASSVKYIFRWI